MGRRVKSEGYAVENDPGATLNGLHCLVCGELQFDTSAGVTCKNGHGGAPSIGPQDVPMLKKKLAEETSAKLKEEMKATEREEQAKTVTRARIEFGSANAAKKSGMRADIVRVVDTVFVNDIEPAYKRLVDELMLGELRKDRDKIIWALDRAQENARLAGTLYVTIKREREAWEKRNEPLFGAMKLKANERLQEEKDNKQRNKAITDSDVTAMCAAIFGDEWIIQEKERSDYKLAEESFKNLAECWRDRANDLRSILSALR